MISEYRTGPIRPILIIHENKNENTF
jgi:hypothetical protein